MSDTKDFTIKNEETMLERGMFTANGYTFAVRPVFLGEEDEYLNDMKISPIPAAKDDGEEWTEKELGTYTITLFSGKLNDFLKIDTDDKSFLGTIKRILNKLFMKKDYRYYDNVPAIQPLVKWLERKVTYKGRKIRFYDLERKFKLNKAEIEKLIIYFHELSGF